MFFVLPSRAILPRGQDGLREILRQDQGDSLRIATNPGKTKQRTGEPGSEVGCGSFSFQPKWTERHHYLWTLLSCILAVPRFCVLIELVFQPLLIGFIFREGLGRAVCEHPCYFVLSIFVPHAKHSLWHTAIVHQIFVEERNKKWEMPFEKKSTLVVDTLLTQVSNSNDNNAWWT